LDVLVNDAGIAIRVNGKKAMVEDVPLPIWNQTIAANLTGTSLVTRSPIRLMK
jgi:NAD(P)-dependent dehydrogenase (short-subunit alcohol dehydrogenase family)